MGCIIVNDELGTMSQLRKMISAVTCADAVFEFLSRTVCSLWTSRECLAARREALIDWLEATKSVYKHQWACTAIDISIKVHPCHIIVSHI